MLIQTWLPTSIPWVPCFGDLANETVQWQCANLTVPVDYLKTSDNKTTQVGIAWAHPTTISGRAPRLLFISDGPGTS